MTSNKIIKKDQEYRLRIKTRNKDQEKSPGLKLGGYGPGTEIDHFKDRLTEELNKKINRIQEIIPKLTIIGGKTLQIY